MSHKTIALVDDGWDPSPILLSISLLGDKDIVVAANRGRFADVFRKFPGLTIIDNVGQPADLELTFSSFMSRSYLKEALRDLKFTKMKADPASYYLWTENLTYLPQISRIRSAVYFADSDPYKNELLDFITSPRPSDRLNDSHIAVALNSDRAAVLVGYSKCGPATYQVLDPVIWDAKLIESEECVFPVITERRILVEIAYYIAKQSNNNNGSFRTQNILSAAETAWRTERQFHLRNGVQLSAIDLRVAELKQKHDIVRPVSGVGYLCFNK